MSSEQLYALAVDCQGCVRRLFVADQGLVFPASVQPKILFGICESGFRGFESEW
jgi:hypothetical protein